MTQEPRRTARASIVATVLIAAGAIALSFRPIYEPDLWWHLAQGRENTQVHLVRTNVFSFAYSDYRQHYTTWLFDTLAYFTWEVGGAAAIQVLHASLLVLTFALLYVACRLRAPAWSTGIVLLLGFFVLEPRAIPRPHLISFAGLAACTLLIERSIVRRSARPLWWAIPVVSIWSNLHVECVFGVALITTFAFVECLRPRSLRQREARIAVLIAVGCLLATLANPYGWGLWQYLYENASVPSILTIAELQPPPLAPYRAFYFYVFVCVVVMARRWRELAVGQLVVFAAFAILGARYLRLTPLVLLASAPVVAEALGSIARPAIARRALVVGAVVATLALPRVPIHVLLSHLAIGSPAVQPAAFFSEDAIAFVESSGLKGYVFNSHNLGGYIAWRLYPQVRIFQDSRLQAYPPEHFLSILVASRSPADWDVLVADVNWAILSLPRPNQMSGVGRFRSDHWETAFNDGAVEIVVRRRLRTAAH